MKLHKNISRYTTVLFEVEGNNIYLSLFWSSLYIGLFLLPFGINLPTPFFILAIIFGTINAFKVKTPRHLIGNKKILLLPLYFVVMALSLIYTENISKGLDLLQRSLSLLFFPIIFLFLKEDTKHIRKLFNFLVVGLILTFFINFAGALYNSISLMGGEVIFDSSIQGGYSFFESFSHGGSYFIGGEFSKLLHPSYVSMYILVALVYYFKNKLAPRFQIIVLSILFLYLFFLASRAAFLILLVISIVLILSINEKRKKYLLLISYMVGLVVIVSNPRVLNTYSRLKDFKTKTNFNYATSEQSRILAWDASLELIKEAPVFGYGLGDVKYILIDKYEEMKYFHIYKKKYNAHNQFLQTLLQTGSIGLCVLISIFVVLGFRIKNVYELSIFLILLISLLFESMLVRFNGIVFCAILIPLLYKRSMFKLT